MAGRWLWIQPSRGSQWLSSCSRLCRGRFMPRCALKGAMRALRCNELQGIRNGIPKYPCHSEWLDKCNEIDALQVF